VVPISRWPAGPLPTPPPQLFPYATVNGLTLGVWVDDRPPADSRAGGPHYCRFILDESAGVLISIGQSAIGTASFCYAAIAEGGSARHAAAALRPAAESLLYLGGLGTAPDGDLTVHARIEFRPVGWAPAPEACAAPSRATVTSPLDFAGFATATRRLLGDAVGRPGGVWGGAAAASDGGGPAATTTAATAAAAAGWPSARRPWPTHAHVQRRLLPVAAGDRLRAALVAAVATAPGVAGRSWTAAVPTPAAAPRGGGGGGGGGGVGGGGAGGGPGGGGGGSSAGRLWRRACRVRGARRRPAAAAVGGAGRRRGGSDGVGGSGSGGATHRQPAAALARGEAARGRLRRDRGAVAAAPPGGGRARQ